MNRNGRGSNSWQNCAAKYFTATQRASEGVDYLTQVVRSLLLITKQHVQCRAGRQPEQ